MRERKWKMTQVDDEAWALVEREPRGPWVELGAVWDTSHGSSPWNAQVEGTGRVTSHSSLKLAKEAIETRISVLSL